MRASMKLLLAVLTTLPILSFAASPAEQRLDDVIVQLGVQQAEIEAQRALIAAQNERIDRLQTKLEAQVALYAAAIERERKEQAVQVAAVEPGPPTKEATTKQVQQAAAEQEPDAAVQKEQGDELAEVAAAPESTKKTSQNEQEDDPTRAILNSLPGAMRIPGTNAVIRMGGYIKTAYVQSFDPLAITDRFLTGAIPVQNDIVGDSQQIDITASQSRLSFDLREPTSVGIVRAYIEGDFTGVGDTFRLRHAFGQTGDVLVGKTWSGLVDRAASPEDLDVEGLNGKINARQEQVRFQPRFGKGVEMLVSLENPNVKVTDGEALSRYPDFIVSGRANFGQNVHLRLAAILRQIRAQWEVDQNTTEEELGYGLSFSGHIEAERWDSRDTVMFQLNVGSGLGRYVNDLNSVGDFDGIFSPTGEMELIDVVSGYVSGQHWWGETQRSNLTFGYVALDSPDFVAGDFYRRTLRASTNLIWSPAPRSSVGGELLWGKRETEDGSSGVARQLQFSVKYLF